MSGSRIKKKNSWLKEFSDINSYSSYNEIAHLAGLQDEPGTHGDIYLDRRTSVTGRRYRPRSVEITVFGGKECDEGEELLSAAGFGRRRSCRRAYIALEAENENFARVLTGTALATGLLAGFSCDVRDCRRRTKSNMCCS